MSLWPCYSQAVVFLGYKIACFCQAPSYFLRKPCVNCSFSVISVSYLNLDHLRLHDVDSLCLPAATGHLLAYFCTNKFMWLKQINDSLCSNSYGLTPEGRPWINFGLDWGRRFRIILHEEQVNQITTKQIWGQVVFQDNGIEFNRKPAGNICPVSLQQFDGARILS